MKTLTNIRNITRFVIDFTRARRAINKYFGEERLLEIHNDPEKTRILMHWLSKVDEGEMPIDEALHCAETDMVLSEFFATV